MDDTLTDTPPEPTLHERLLSLREPFPDEVVGKLPRGGVELDFVGHAAVTQRLLLIDPEWNWEPLGTDENGLPVYDNNGGLWIKLTICGVTRLGYGDGADPKVRIGDAIRNAAMRFGVALMLWSRDELETQVGTPAVTTRRRAPRSSTSTKARTDPATDGEVGMSARDRNRMVRALANLDPPLRDEPSQLAYIAGIIDKNLPAIAKITAADGEKVLRELGVEPA
jgi:hypothetical protein